MATEKSLKAFLLLRLVTLACDGRRGKLVPADTPTQQGRVDMLVDGRRKLMVLGAVRENSK